ncbi:MAG: TIGR03087 family PEP-CTERM/XrtA system glycosyltransferase [Methylococcales bacterium]|nr:TIGR03087 family PEP-CTERM/XrtA system glycosyltransferase [Methylococcaceae bacterium]
MENLLFLAHRIPYPPNKGDKIRSFHLLKRLSKHYQVHLGTYIDDPADWQHVDKLNALCARTHYLALTPRLAKIKSLIGLLTGQALSVPYYNNQVMQAWVDQTISQYQIKKVLIFSSPMSQFINDSHDVEMVVDFVDVDSDKWRQYAAKKSGLPKWIYQRESEYLLKFEREIAAKAKASVFVSEQEAGLFKQLAPEGNDKITHINNGVDTDYFSPEQSLESPFMTDEVAMVFTGAMDYWANVDAVTWFANEVFPGIINSYPSAKFYIVGSKPSKEVQELARQRNIVVTGAVDDVRPYIAHAKMVVAPLRIARGIQNKVLEAMAMGKYVVATTAAMEGIVCAEPIDVAIDDEAEAMAKHTVEWLRMNPQAFASTNNREFVQLKFSWGQNLSRLMALLQ